MQLIQSPQNIAGFVCVAPVFYSEGKEVFNENLLLKLRLSKPLIFPSVPLYVERHCTTISVLENLIASELTALITLCVLNMNLEIISSILSCGIRECNLRIVIDKSDLIR
jgi:hypothetical protein